LSDFAQRQERIGFQRGMDRFEIAEPRFITRATIPTREAAREQYPDLCKKWRALQSIFTKHRLFSNQRIFLNFH
jgi:hypothetical protein